LPSKKQQLSERKKINKNLFDRSSEENEKRKSDGCSL
jgi:hypothetical protein